MAEAALGGVRPQRQVDFLPLAAIGPTVRSTDASSLASTSGT
ncbi:hypothetical protein [Streptomyces sp. IB201691-2A2]|nr:hypothetical protein [Streptomyces sp. IB201691-2A2]